MTAQRLIEVGRVAGAFGVRGEIRITTFTEDPLALLRYRALKRADGSPGVTLTAGRAAKGGIVARAKEIETRDQAEAARGLKLFIDRTALPAPEEDEFYLTDLDRPGGTGYRWRCDRDGSERWRISAPAICWRSRPPPAARPGGCRSRARRRRRSRIGEGWLTVIRPDEIEGED